MTAVLERPTTTPQRDGQRPQPRRPDPAPRRAPATEGMWRQTSVVVLLLAALLPFSRVFASADWVPHVFLAALLALVLAWATRRLRAGLLTTFALLAVAWSWYTALVFLPWTLWAGLVPTRATATTFVDMALVSALRIQTLPAPAFPEPSLLLVTVAGVWWIAVIVHVLATRLHSPGKAIFCAFGLWIVPLAMSPETTSAWAMALPFLAAAATLMLSFASNDVRRWGFWVASGADHRQEQHTGRLATSGALITVLALLAGTVLAGSLPGFGEPPWYELRGRAASTLTDNPIVQIRSNLVAQDTGTIMRVRSEQPVYLRTTALDTYSETEEWTTSTIEAAPLGGGGRVPGAPLSGDPREVRVEVTDLHGGVLVPAPAGAIAMSGFDDKLPLFDQRTNTFTLDGDVALDTGDTYAVIASEPAIDADRLEDLEIGPVSADLTALPDNVPDEVGQIAQGIVAEAGAEHPFTQALAIQNELRSWEYSLEPPQGHGSTAMRSFLETRVGYCEQFAGTMAVMLRTLGIPSRVAVGFTPGTISPEEPTLWTVSWANAHAWVEVPFEGQWIRFEPTPRADGNVLVPSESDIAPAETVLPAVRNRQLPDPSSAEIYDYLNLDEALANRGAPQVDEPVNDFSSGAGGVSRRLANPRLFASLAGLTLALLLLLAYFGRTGDEKGANPRTRVLRARHSIGRLAVGLGVRPTPAETDREYLTRLVAAKAPVEVLAAASARARYGPQVPSAVADEAELAAGDLEHMLVGNLPGWRQGLVRIRGDVATGYLRMRQLLRRLIMRWARG